MERRVKIELTLNHHIIIYITVYIIRKRDTIKNQLIKLNALVEWDYEYFTMDEVEFIIK